jgi:hypothetical protein
MKREGSYDFVETPITEATQFSQALTLMNIVFDPVALEEMDHEPRITFHLYDLPAIFAYRWIVRLSGLELGLRADYEPGSITISSPDTIVERSVDWLPLPLQLDSRPPEFKPKWMWEYQVALRKKVSYEFRDVDIPSTLDYLKQKSGLNLVIDPEAVAAKKDVRITLPNATEPLRQVLKRIEEASGLTHSLSDNAYHITLPVQKEAPMAAQ